MRLFQGTEFDIPPTCDRCGKLESDCDCPPPETPQVAPEKQSPKIAVEKRKKGKMVTVIRNLAEKNNHSNLLTDLKNHCGSGGTIKEGNIEIQGDHLDRVKAFLKNKGFRSN